MKKLCLRLNYSQLYIKSNQQSSFLQVDEIQIVILDLRMHWDCSDLMITTNWNISNLMFLNNMDIDFWL